MVDFFSKTHLSLPQRLYVPFVGSFQGFQGFQGFRDLNSIGWTIGRVIGQTITPILSWTSQEHEHIDSGPFYKLGDEVDEVEGFFLIIKIDELEHRQLEAAAQTARTASLSDKILSDKILSDKILSHEPCESMESDVEDELKQLMTNQIQSIQTNIRKNSRLLLLATRKITALQTELRSLKSEKSDNEKTASVNEQIQKLQAAQGILRNRLSALTEELKTLCT